MVAKLLSQISVSYSHDHCKMSQGWENVMMMEMEW